ncbi:MAG: hypothetical protein LBN09_05725 [Clostridioides sp.]|jgi:peptide/nickel transport system substrate-binding protein|nr:hypothetical protein [Clostridioides sp.]
MRKNKLETSVIALLTVCAISTGLVGCSQSSDKGESTTKSEKFVFPVGADIATLDFLNEGGSDEGDLMLGEVYDPMYIDTKEGTNYYLAEKYEASEDLKTLTVTLKKYTTYCK